MEVNCGSLPLGILFLFRPTPSCRLSPACLPQIIPRPQVGGRADRYRFACGRRRHNPLVSHRARPLSHAVRSLLPAIARSCSLPLIPDFFHSMAFRSPSRFSYRAAGRGADFVSPVPRSSPASIDMGKAGRGYRLADFSPPRPFRLSCLLACGFFLFPTSPVWLWDIRLLR